MVILEPETGTLTVFICIEEGKKSFSQAVKEEMNFSLSHMATLVMSSALRKIDMI